MECIMIMINSRYVSGRIRVHINEMFKSTVSELDPELLSMIAIP